MSKVFSFRLSEDNPREALARDVIESWVKKRYSVRNIVTEALRNYSERSNSHPDMDIVLNQLKEIFQIFENNLTE